MKKFTYIFALLGFYYSIGLSQSCLNNGIVFTSQSQIDSFSTNYPDCEHIEGHVAIEIPSLTLETSLAGLAQIKEIDSSLTIRANCPNFLGLHNLESVGKDLRIISTHTQVSTGDLSALNHVGGNIELNGVIDAYGFSQIDTIHGKLMVWFGDLKNFEGFEALKYVGDYVWISDSDSLESLNGLQNLETVENDFYLFGTPSCPLHSLEGLSGLRKIGGRLAIESMPFLRDAKGLDSLTHLGGFSTTFSHFETLDGLQGVSQTESISINISPHMKRLTGLEEFVEVGQLSISGCDSILDLEGLSGLRQVEDLTIYGNENLINLNGIENLDTIFNDLRIHRNPKFESFEGFQVKAVLGGVWLRDLPSLKDFSSLCCLDQINEILSAQETGLVNLSGLEDIKTIRGLRLLLNDSLQSLTGLENLEELQFLSLFQNEMLSDISALSNIQSESFIESMNSSISITDNPLLGFCSIDPICEALDNPNVTSDISNNLGSCNSRELLLSQCLSSSEDYLKKSIIEIFPNPFSEIIWVESREEKTMLLLNHLGNLVRVFQLKQGLTQIGLGDIPAGVYFLRGEGEQAKKIVKQ